MKTLKISSQTNGGRAVKTAKDLLEDNPKTNRFLVMCILKGLGLEVDFMSMSRVKFKESIEVVNSDECSFITVSVLS